MSNISSLSSFSTAMLDAAQAAQSANTTSGRAAMFRRSLGNDGVRSFGASYNIDPNNDDELAAASTLAAKGRIPSAGNSTTRWNKDFSDGWYGEEYGLEMTTTLVAATGAVITVTPKMGIALDDAVLVLWDPTGVIVGNGGYWSTVKVEKREMVLGATDATEFKPCDADDLAALVGEGNGSAGGIYLGSLEDDDQLSVGVYIPTSVIDVPWGLVLRGTPVAKDKGYKLLQGSNLRRSRFVR